jgi:homogentisate 1,2-dioxygenase
MPIYHKLGEVPAKRHTVFENPEGGIYYEQLMGNLGFTGPSSLLYFKHRPTRVRETRLLRELVWERDEDRTLRLRHFFTHRLKSAGASPTLDRVPMLFNDDVAISQARVAADALPEVHFYRNGMADEVVFVTEGRGVLESQLGELTFGPGDYLVIPRGVLHRYRLEGAALFFVIESASHVRTPRRYRNELGQLLEHSPFCERDIRRPERLLMVEEPGDHQIIVKQRSALHAVTVDHHPWNVVGWDGYYYPFAFNIGDFEPIVGRLHQPPPVHQTFEADGFVLCSFVPRLFDFHPRAIPAPYHHSNVMADEVLYYTNGNFMSRKGIEQGSVTLHPDGLPHGPHPGTVEASIGAKETNETAVMIDTYRPLHVARRLVEVEDGSYGTSWLE